MEKIIGAGEAAVKVAGLKKIADKKATFDGITLILFGGAVENFNDLTITGDAILSIGAAFDDVTISAGASNPVYFSRTANGSTLNGVLQPKATAKVNSEQWQFNDTDSFIVDGAKIFIGEESFDCAADLAACEIQFGKVLSETTAIKLANVHYDRKNKSLDIRKEQKNGMDKN